MFSETIDILYRRVLPCNDGVVRTLPPFPPQVFQFASCDEYWDDEADVMQIKSFRTAGWWGMVFAICIIGNVLTFIGFGTASERMNKRVRDLSFAALWRQEVGFFGTSILHYGFCSFDVLMKIFHCIPSVDIMKIDKQSVGKITSQLQDDAARIHAFSGEPVRAFLTAVASVVTGVALSFYVRASCFKIILVSSSSLTNGPCFFFFLPFGSTCGSLHCYLLAASR
jgi:ATP-binding cassette, subfamily B (MDR/TAP), member 1